MFSVHSEIKSTTFDPSDLFCGDGGWRARSKIGVHFFALTQSITESAGSRRQLGASPRAWTCSPEPRGSGVHGPGRAERPPSARPPVLTAVGVQGLAGLDHQLGVKLRPQLTFAWIWALSSLPSTTLVHLGPGCPFLTPSPPSHKNTLTVAPRFGKLMALPSPPPGGEARSRPSSGLSRWILEPRHS